MSDHGSSKLLRTDTVYQPLSPDGKPDGKSERVAEGCKHLEKLKAAGVIGMRRAVRISAAPADGTPALQENQRLVHLQRHGQGFHNLTSEYLRNLGVELAASSGERSVQHPYKLPEMVDPPLTDKGREQCKARRETVSELNPPVVFVSPLCRAVQTALITFNHLVRAACPPASLTAHPMGLPTRWTAHTRNHPRRPRPPPSIDRRAGCRR